MEPIEGDSELDVRAMRKADLWISVDDTVETARGGIACGSVRVGRCVTAPSPPMPA